MKHCCELVVVPGSFTKKCLYLSLPAPLPPSVLEWSRGCHGQLDD